MTREHSQSQAPSKCSAQRPSITGGVGQHDAAASANPSGGFVSNSSGDRRHQQSDSARPAHLRGSLLFQKRQPQLDCTASVAEQQQQRLLNHHHHHQSDSKKTFSGQEESIGAVNFHCGSNHQNQHTTESLGGTGNELSSDNQHLDSKCSEAMVVSPQNQVPPPMLLKRQTIYYEGKFKTVLVQVWPDKNPRIPLHQRHRLQDPMRQHYGKLSNKARLVKEFENYEKSKDGQPIPLLPRRMRDEAKVRLMAWYRPLDLRCGHSLPGEAAESSRQSSQSLSSR